MQWRVFKVLTEVTKGSFDTCGLILSHIFYTSLAPVELFNCVIEVGVNNIGTSLF